MSHEEEKFTDLLTQAIIGINDIRERIDRLIVAEAVKELQLPQAIVEPVVRKALKKERLGRPLLEGEIKDAISKHKTMRGAANYLRVTSVTLKKYLRLYGLYDLLWKPTRGTKSINPRKKKDLSFISNTVNASGSGSGSVFGGSGGTLLSSLYG